MVSFTWLNNKPFASNGSHLIGGEREFLIPLGLKWIKQDEQFAIRYSLSQNISVTEGSYFVGLFIFVSSYYYFATYTHKLEKLISKFWLQKKKNYLFLL